MPRAYGTQFCGCFLIPPMNWRATISFDPLGLFIPLSIHVPRNDIHGRHGGGDRQTGIWAIWLDGGGDRDY